MNALAFLCIPAGIAFLVIFVLYLNRDANPLHEKPGSFKNGLLFLRDLAAMVLIVFLLNIAFGKFFDFIGGAR